MKAPFSCLQLEKECALPARSKKKSEQEFSAERLEAFHKVKHPDAG
ncbi:hypothetical protein [Bradyrhizobium japonicum]|nr:hypothetical protein [Bradyrhizobium japonicum]